MLRLIGTLIAVVLTVGDDTAAQQKPVDPNRWEPAIQKFEAEDKAHPPVKGGIVFIGASSIVRWSLAESFPDLKAVNRGFGGSEMADTRATRLVLSSLALPESSFCIQARTI